MINVVPYTNRRLTWRNREKILRMFPNEPVTIIEESAFDPKRIKWAEKTARFFVIHGVDTSYEVNAMYDYNHLEILAKLGCRLIFTWNGMKSRDFLNSFTAVNIALSMHKNYPDIPITIRYRQNANPIEGYDLMNGCSSIEFLLSIPKNYKGVTVEFAYPTPWRNDTVRKFLCGCLDYLHERDLNHTIKVVSCGNLTITPNTNIYPCQWLPRRKRKQFFGNADRDKNVIGTLRRGFFREFDISKCNLCKKRQKIKGR